jgi:FtsH-binding integral membrane protein
VPWIAVLEAVVIWATHGLHIATIIVVAAVAFGSLMLYQFTTERTRSNFLHELAWLLAASQL